MGFLHIYTGNGKGKTTCSVGVAVRALGAGLPVKFVQFDKGYDGTNEHYNERKILRSLPGLELQPFGLERMMPDGRFRFQNESGDFEEARAAMTAARRAIKSFQPVPADAETGSGPTGLVVLDEIVTCAGTKLLSQEDVVALAADYRASRAGCDLIMTGRGAWPELLEMADLVTEMTLVKHYWYEHKTPPRAGVDF